jgi:phosphoribosylformimino-5-aminoimidazole carboxamide ribotide isomerase
MEILPAIDLRGGVCVRLAQGDAARQTVYSDDPVAVARSFKDVGARWLHVVDLDGAFSGVRRHTDTVRAIVDATGLSIELGGGVRSLDDVRACLDAGCARVVLGTAAHEQPDFLRAALDQFGDAIAVGIDCRNGRVALRGWIDQTETPVASFAAQVAAAGVATLIYTDIAVDGMQAGPDCGTLRSLLGAVRARVIASGGIASLAHIAALRALTPRPPDGCIIGKALYAGSLDLRAALAAAAADYSPSPLLQGAPSV